jgi:hypothetical protein
MMDVWYVFSPTLYLTEKFQLSFITLNLIYFIFSIFLFFIFLFILLCIFFFFFILLIRHFIEIVAYGVVYDELAAVFIII